MGLVVEWQQRATDSKKEIKAGDRIAQLEVWGRQGRQLLVKGISDTYWAYSRRNYTQDYALDSILVRSTRHIKQTHSASRTQQSHSSCPNKLARIAHGKVPQAKCQNHLAIEIDFQSSYVGSSVNDCVALE